MLPSQLRQIKSNQVGESLMFQIYQVIFLTCFVFNGNIFVLLLKFVHKLELSGFDLTLWHAYQVSF